MKKYLFLFLLLFSSPTFAQVTINVTSVPANTPANASIYIAGSFNNWDPANVIYILTNNGGTYSITLPAGTGTIQFKVQHKLPKLMLCAIHFCKIILIQAKCEP